MLGSGEVICKLQMSWDELLNHGDEPFDLSFPSVRRIQSSLTLKAAVVQACDDQDGALPNSLADCEMNSTNRCRPRAICQIHEDHEGPSPERCRKAFSVGSGPVSGQPS
ncbi:hypothetical protein EDD22DRAFT_972048 [Suillus occidentalis]|nr:hypothetical protein EDD22DRAFT_972048 [Suillus occidentalis]